MCHSEYSSFMGPRQTFAFDRVLYCDDQLEVTPSAVILGGQKHIDIDRIGIVRFPPATKPPLLKPRWWQRVAPSERTRARAPPMPPVPNILLDVADDDRIVTMSLRVDNPEDVKTAIADARAIVY